MMMGDWRQILSPRYSADPDPVSVGAAARDDIRDRHLGLVSFALRPHLNFDGRLLAAPCKLERHFTRDGCRNVQVRLPLPRRPTSSIYDTQRSLKKKSFAILGVGANGAASEEAGKRRRVAPGPFPTSES